MASTSLRWSERVEEAEWVLPLLDDLLDGTVCVRVPHGFQKYARVLHPITTRDERISWRQVARRNERAFDRTVGWRSIALPEGNTGEGVDGRTGGPLAYRTPAEVLPVLVEHLVAETGSPQETWGACWDGMGLDTSLGPSDGAGVIYIGGNQHQLFTGPVTEVAALDDCTPNLWWPADRAWVVGRFIEDMSTYIACSHRLLARLLDDHRLEVVEVEPDDRIGTDETNSPPL